ncbi:MULTISPECIES: serine/threonine-protein kinase [unclassified Azospirillum]|uniref:serine/threonine-protein kinase n=1 Tax=unclassified Azospirillum TaxID=2630922 RepID=UPI000B75A9A4|nr:MULTISPECIES: serine/threonine-protein kinase [unclassified Azospirillum]SNS67864.1 serine/threonine protein kinase [Azospirillum sp. RU38E]SNS86077.1 serine/threonine protein kinase [Azospirillum sp. RU37A]
MLAQTIGKYRIERTIGSGTYGTVLEAWDRVLNRTVALKLLRASDAAVADMNTHLQEARALARLSHPNIVTIFDLGQDGEHTFLVMEHIDGEALASRLRDGRLPLPTALAMARQLADALAAAHRAGVIHADIKPGNIILDRQFRPLLVDFGLARLSLLADTQGTLGTGADPGDSVGRGTTSYMAPELFMGAQPDIRSDIFAFGAVLFEMLSGQRAFAASNAAAVMQRILNGRPDPLQTLCPDLPSALCDLVARMMEPDPARRISSMGDVRARLDALLGKEAVIVSPPWWQRVGHLRFTGAWRWRRSAAAAGAGGVLLLALWLAADKDLLPEMPPRSIQSMVTQAMGHLYRFEDRGAIDAAVSNFQMVLARDPQNAAATAGLSLALFRRYTAQQPDPAVLKQADAAARLALSLDSQLALAHIAVAWAESYAHNAAAAYRHFEIAQSLDKGNLLGLEGLARLYRTDGRLDDAIATSLRGIEIDPNYRLFHDEIGRIYFDRADYAKAEAEFRRSIAVAPDSAIGYANLSAAQHMQGRTSDAIGTIQQGLRVRPDAMLYNNLGSYLYFLGQYPQAAEAFESLLRLEGNGQRYLVWGNLGDAYRWTAGKEEEARNAYRLALRYLEPKLKARPKDPIYNIKAALYYAKLGEQKPALAALETALAAPTAAILFDAAVTNEILGQREAALTLLAQARKAGYAQDEINSEPELAKLRLDRKYQQSLIQG